jgi:hypothetical protein
MHLPDFDDPDFHPDLMDMKRWSEVPQPIRKIVEQHVAARFAGRYTGKTARPARARTSYQ